jgi:hypothetical protein
VAGWAAELLVECGGGARAGELLALAREAELAAAGDGSGERPAFAKPARPAAGERSARVRAL